MLWLQMVITQVLLNYWHITQHINNRQGTDPDLMFCWNPKTCVRSKWKLKKLLIHVWMPPTCYYISSDPLAPWKAHQSFLFSHLLSKKSSGVTASLWVSIKYVNRPKFFVHVIKHPVLKRVTYCYWSISLRRNGIPKFYDYSLSRLVQLRDFYAYKFVSQH
jgi:hypothetical protein